MKTGYKLHQGDSPLLISIPHVGTTIPDALRPVYTAAGLTVQDTDWHLDRLYDFARELGATILCAEYSRYVIDLNRPRSDESLYPGKVTTGLCPTETFLGEDVYQAGQAPDAAQKAQRVAQYWQPYHETLTQQIMRLRARHPHIVVWEAHSIKSRLPRLFDGKLWDLNLGTADGHSAAPAIAEAVFGVASAEQAYTSILNGRFKGGYITRHYGVPEQGVHTVQLEKCWSTYMHEEAPYTYAPARAQQLQPLLRSMLQAAVAALPTHDTPAPVYPD
ncbi:N-formylglutamate deformylase [Robbsia sp. KACC 23696]|uniref:N-formylglutamate deformylase n=1 Tax=Robbsia sp. KACC 23696 TaxID=3149231 RepID=UPI00325B266E